MTMPGIIIEVAVSVLLVIGGLFALIGSWGMVRLPTLMERLHGPTKATTLGLGGILVASVLFFQLYDGTWSAHELLISLFLFITAPISANMIAKVHLHRLHTAAADEPCSPAGHPGPAPGGIGWATLVKPHPDSRAATSEE